MSHNNTQAHPVISRAEKGLGALPVWTSIAVIVAALVTGLIISTIVSSVGWPFLICFIFGALAATALVQVRGLFLTVASIPVLFAVLILIASWLVTRASQSEGSPMFSPTVLITSAYPLLEVFPHLFFTLLACIAIAVFRLYRVKNTASTINSTEQASRRRMAESDRRNRETTTRARETTKRLSVQDLVERNKAQERKRNTAQAPRSGTRPSTEGTAASTTSRTSASRSTRSSTSRRMPRTDESRRGSYRTASRDASAGSARGVAREGSRERSTRRITDAQVNQEQARRTQSAERRHATDGAVNAAGADRASRLRPDPRRRAGDAAQTQKPAAPQTSAAPQKSSAPQQRPDTRKRAPRALDEDLYGE